MKRLITTLCLLISFSLCLFAEPEVISTSTKIPFELRGEWYSLSYSENRGETEDKTYKPVFRVTKDTVISRSYILIDKIVSVQKFSFNKNNNIGYALYSEDGVTVYLVLFYADLGGLPLVYIFKDTKEQCRMLINIVKQNKGGVDENN